MIFKKKNEKPLKKLSGKRAKIIESLALNSIKKVKVDLNSALVRREFKITNEILECMNVVEKDIKTIFEYKSDSKQTFLSIIRKNSENIHFYDSVDTEINYGYLVELLRAIEKQIDHLENIAYFISSEHEISTINIDNIIINFKQYKDYIFSTISFESYDTTLESENESLEDIENEPNEIEQEVRPNAENYDYIVKDVENNQDINNPENGGI